MIGIAKPFTVSLTGELVINHDAIRGMEPFASILSRKRIMDGDSDGRKKVFNFMELKYIYYMADYDVHHTGLTDNERPIKARQDAGFDKKWKPDELVIAGIAKYIEVVDKYIPTARTLISILKGLAMSSIGIDSYTKQMQLVIEANEASLVDIKDEQIRAEIELNNKLIQSNIKEILDIAIKLPKVLDTITALQGKVRKEEGSAKLLQGDKNKRNREDPN